MQACLVAGQTCDMLCLSMFSAALSLDSGDLVKFQIYEDLSCMMLPGQKKETVKGAKRSCPEIT